MSVSAIQSYGYRHSHSQTILSSQITPQSAYRNSNQGIPINDPATMSSKQPSTPPRTPRRPANDRQPRNAAVESATDSAPESQAKPKSTRRNKGRNTNTTPAGPRTDRGTPPVRVQPGSYNKPPTTTAIAAYAGPTFHASPAPSALPIPSFFSKPAPESPSLKASDTDVDQSSSSSGDSPPLLAQKLATEHRREESPLDIFFNADRKEKERARNAQAQREMPQSSQRAQSGEMVTPVQGRCRLPLQTGGSGSRMFSMEMEGTPGKPYGPAFSTPYSERISAARSGSNMNSPATSTPTTVERSEALKSFLFNGATAPASRPHQGESTRVSSETMAPTNQNWAPPQPTNMNNYYGSPQQVRSASYGYGADAPNVYPGGFRNAPRSSGLRQEFTQPLPAHNRMGGGFQSPQPYNHKENATSGVGVAATNNQAASNLASRKDIQNMEDRLRSVLKIGSSSGAPGNF